MHPLLITILFLHCALTSSHLVAQQQAVNFTQLFDGIELRPPESAFIAPPREVIRPLLRCKKLMAAGKVDEAVEILGEVLADESVEDFLIPRGSQSFSSLRSRTEQILGSIDARFLEPYQIRYGIRARKLLERGVAENDLSLLKKASNQFFFTDSGAEAAMLLGHLELSNGQPSAAQSWFAKIVRFRSTAAKHDPEASILLATCQMLSNNRDAAEETLVSLKQRMPNSTIQLMGENYTLFNRNPEAIPWLTRLIGDSPLASNRTLSRWLMFQGNPARTGKVGTGMPLMAPRWEHATASSIALKERSTEYLKELVQEKTVPAPAVQPLVVGDTIVFRDVDHMYGVDFESGLRKWAWPPRFAWNDTPSEKVSVAAALKMNQRLVMDSIYGRASSDGRLIFFVPQPGSSSQYDHDNVFANADDSAPEDLRTHNELVAIDSENSGMLRWRVGGPKGFDEPKLAKAFFMGEPLPLEGVLYCCCVLDNAVQLVALDSKTGKLRWIQAIAAFDHESFDANHNRRLAGVSPSYANGKIVCLTGTGAVVALEVSTRTLLWGYEYRLPRNTRIISDSNNYPNMLNDAWRDSQVTIANGMVYLTPVLSRELICLDLDNGEGVWYEEDGFLPRKVERESSLYLAGINQGQLILVGSRNVRAIDSFSGVETWRLPLAADDLPSGRGYIGVDSLFLPTTSRKILRIDLADGKIAESVGTGRILGNLSRVQGDVVSHGVDHVASYPEFGASREAIDRLPVATLNEQQQFAKSQILIQQGELESGLDLLISLAEQNSDPKYSSLLDACANNFQMDSPSLSLRALDALKRLYPRFDVDELERMRLLSKLRTGEFAESIDLGLTQIEGSFARIPDGVIVESSDSIVESVNATLLDRPIEWEADPGDVPGVEVVDFENRYDTIQYSEVGWHRAKLQMAIEGLREYDPDAAAQVYSRTADLVSNALDGTDDEVQWLLDRLPESVMDLPTLELIANHRLEQKKYLIALFYANTAIGRGGDGVEEFKLLKARILLAGRDLNAAKKVLDSVDFAVLDDTNRQELESLNQQVTVQVAADSGMFNSSAAGSDADWPGFETGYIRKTQSKKQTPIRYRLPFVFDPATDADYRKTRLFLSPWGDHRREFEVRNSRGNVVRELQLRDENLSGSFGYSQRCQIDIQNHVAELTLNKITLIVDWFNVISGDGGNLWELPHEQVSPVRTAFSGMRELVVAEQNMLHCYETHTGKVLWKRKMAKPVNRIVTHGSLLTAWSEEGRQFNTIETATGRLVRTVKSKRFIVSRSLIDKFVMWHPIRKGELPADQENALAGPDGPANPAKVAIRMAVFDAGLGRLAWQRVNDNRARSYYRVSEVCTLDPHGTLAFVDLGSGETLSQTELPLTDSEKRSLQGINLRRHRAGWVLHVKLKDRADPFSRGKSTYRFNQLHYSLGSGPVFLLGDASKQLVWKDRVYLERMEYMNNQPFDSPVIMFGRHIARHHSSDGEMHYLQSTILDAKTGRLIGSDVVKTLESYNGHAIEWKPGASGASAHTLAISTPTQVQSLTFGSDVELPPVPQTHLTFNALDFFDDTNLERPQAVVADVRVGEFRARALEASKVRKARLPQAAAELKKRLRVGSQ
ncbi:outer membrane protein assembly factor BamB family protein [Mariniblastus fucicola]|uniref:Outer membrane protein assembly factor BamB n=1 Tax=Mariniblastus fucicola TaxID=980251 RepID=A0A5B9PBP8_9BACT|nr:PQQ-binding-like beta-propeller repeat protein [Mariniblastus fucicola]QEG21916.1 Outer membrane protein assembly factor BamB [Mariniblastus fucicola]